MLYESRQMREASTNQFLDSAAVVIKAASSPIPKTGAGAARYVWDGKFKSLGAATDCPLTGVVCNVKVPTGYTGLFVLAINGSDDMRDPVNGNVVTSGGIAAGAAQAFQGAIFAPEVITVAGYPDTRQRAYRYSKDASGNTVLKAVNNYAKNMSQLLKDLPEGFIPYAVVKVVNASGADFVPGTTALDAAGLTVTFTSVQVLPQSANF